MMTDNAFTAAMKVIEAGVAASAKPSFAFDVRLDKLPSAYQAAVRHEIDRGALDHATIDGLIWVSEADLFELAGPGADHDDLDGGCYIPANSKAQCGT